MRPETGGSEDFNSRILKPLLEYVAAMFGENALVEVAADAGFTPAQLRRGCWMPHERFEAVLASARRRMRDDREFQEACVYRLAESYGPTVYLVRAGSVRRLYALMSRTMHVVARAARYELVASSRTSATLRYTTERTESALMCLSRRVQITHITRYFGLPPATVEEPRCVARGDPCCEYHLRWQERPRWPSALVGIGLGLVAAYALVSLGAATTVLFGILPPLGASLAWILELQRTNRANLAAAAETNEALRGMAEEANEAREEVLAITQRREDWTRLLEEQVEERTTALSSVVAQVQRLREEQATNLRGLSHDLRNPLTLLRLQHHLLREHEENRDQILKDMGRALDQVDGLLKTLLESALAESARPAVAPARIEIAPLVERLRRRLRALVFGRDIRVTVLPGREAPEAIVIDPLVFDRIVDNLLTNAAKYTERGSIVVELGGAPGMLCLKVSDTGAGIAEERIERVFHPGASTPGERAANSYGIGLSSVLQLLGQCGGRLEVMSKPGAGTTFWAYLPIEPPAPASHPAEAREDVDTLIGRVVRIRRSA